MLRVNLYDLPVPPFYFTILFMYKRDKAFLTALSAVGAKTRDSIHMQVENYGCTNTDVWKTLHGVLKIYIIYIIGEALTTNIYTCIYIYILHYILYTNI